jgi:hypothetical protein
MATITVQILKIPVQLSVNPNLYHRKIIKLAITVLTPGDHMISFIIGPLSVPPQR